MDPKQNDDDDLLKDLDGMDDKLNLTADEKDDDDFKDEQIEQEYLKFMKDLQGGGEGKPDFDPMVGQLTNLMGQLLKNINEEAKDAENPDQKAPDAEQFQEMFKNIEENPQFDQFADQLLYQFMEKDILEEPLKEATVNYKKYLDENKEKIAQIDYLRFQNQQKCIDLILAQLQADPNQKEKLVNLFEQMQEYGNPPEAVFGADSPLAMINQLQENQGSGQGQGALNQDCQIF